MELFTCRTHMDSYDQFLYESIPFPETHPRHLAALGRLFGLNTANPTNCRILELGCATGGNLIPTAWYCPGNELIGIDLSANQVEKGQALINKLGLQNIELRQGDILDLNEDLDSFDFIIVHGVYSWVPSAVREHLLDLSRKLLKPNVLLYLSFNTLPGWRMRGMLRDILLHACRGIEDANIKLKTAHTALERLEKSVAHLNALSARYLKEEIGLIRQAHPSYLLYEYLATENNAFLFSDFLNDISAKKLRYLCDTELAGLFPSTFGDATENALSDIEDDMEVEQWLDFVSNRNFRRAVLCRDDAEPDDELSLDAFTGFAFGTSLIPPPKMELRRDSASPFREPDGTRVEIQHPLTKALLVEMHRLQPDLILLQDLMPRAVERVAQAGGRKFAEDIDSCLMELFSLFSHRSLTASPVSELFQHHIVETPRISHLARAELNNGQNHLSTAQHSSLDLDSFSVRLLHHLDGHHNIDEIANLLFAEMKSGTLPPPDEFTSRNWPETKLRARITENCNGLIKLFSQYGILTPD